jgi:hypothetical protein
MKQNVGFTKGRTAEHARPRVTSPSCGRRRRRLGSGAKRPRRCRCNAPAKSRPPLRQAYVSRGPLLQMARRRLHPSWPRITLTPDSSVPSQHTPSSTTDVTFPQHQPMPSAISATSMSYPHTASTSSFHPPATYKRYSQITDHNQPYGSSSPYGAAYARRGASYQTTPTMSLRGVGDTTGMAGSGAFYDQGRRHSEATVPPLATAPSLAPLSASTGSDAPMSAESQAESPLEAAQAQA